MATLYELTGIYQDLSDLGLDEETLTDTLSAMDWQEDFINKVEGYVKVVKSLDGDIALIDEEIKRLQERKSTAKNRQQTLKQNLQTAMEKTGNERVKTALFSVAVTNTKASVVVDEDKLDRQYMVETVTVKPDKKVLYDLLKDGQEIAGAELKPNRSLRIR